MGLRDFFYNIINKFKKNELKQLPAPQTIINNNDEVYEPEVEKNAYVNAYTNKINTKKSELKINEDGTRIKFIDSKTNKQIEVQRITKIKEKLEFNATNIDLYKAIYSIGSKEDRKLKNAILLDCAIGAMVVGTIIGLKMHKCYKYRKESKYEE